MLSNWIKALKTKENINYNQHQLGSMIEAWNHSSDFIGKSDITILFGADVDPYPILNQLYEKYSNFHLRIILLGQLKKNTLEYTLPVVKELLSNNKIIFVGGSRDLDSVFQTTERHDLPVEKSLIIHSKIDDAPTLDCNYLAFQRHLNNPKLLEQTPSYKKCGLGNLKKNIRKAEPLIRDRDYIKFELDAISKQFNTLAPNLVGLNVFESCQISKYAGHNHCLKLFHIATVNPNTEDTNELVALMIWYLLEGLNNCLIDRPNDFENRTYLVENAYFGNALEFVESKLTGRFWLKNPSHSEHKSYIPCELSDFEEMSKGELSERFSSL